FAAWYEEYVFPEYGKDLFEENHERSFKPSSGSGYTCPPDRDQSPGETAPQGSPSTRVDRMRPLSSVTMLSPSFCACSSWCVAKSTAPPRATCSSTSVSSSLFPCSSRPVCGSSSMSNRGECSS